MVANKTVNNTSVRISKDTVRRIMSEGLAEFRRNNPDVDVKRIPISMLIRRYHFYYIDKPYVPEVKNYNDIQ